MAGSRLLGAAAACALLCFAAGHRKSYWSGRTKAAIMICKQISSFSALVIFLFAILLNIPSKSFFLLWRRDPSGFGAAISDAVARSSIVFGNSVFADRIVMAGSRLLGAAAACALLCFAAGHRKSYWSGRTKAAIMICKQISSFSALVIFLFAILLNIPSKSFFLLWRRDPSGFGAAISDAVARSSIVFGNSVFADRIVMAGSRLLGVAAACAILLCFAAGHRKSYWSGRTKAAIMICKQISSFSALVIFLFAILLNIPSKSFFLLWRRDPSGFGAAISDAVARSSIVFGNSVFADRIVMAGSRLLGAAAACAILLSFAVKLAV